MIQANQYTPSQIRPTLIDYIPAWQRNTEMGTPGACPVCGMPPGVPGYLRNEVLPGDPDFGKIIPCPKCHGEMVRDRLRQGNQLTGWLRDASFEGYRIKRLNQGELSKALADRAARKRCRVDELMPVDRAAVEASLSNQAALDAARKFANSPTGWLTLWGSYGPGKTHLLASIVNQCVADGVMAIYFTLAGLLDIFRASVGDGDLPVTFDRTIKAQVLVVDEVTSEAVNLTPWTKERIRELFEARYRGYERLGTVFATNDKPEVQGDCYWDFLYSRMHDRRFVVIEVGGGDYRPLKS